MLKELTAEGRFECGFDEATVGRVVALTVHIDKSGDYGLGIAYANEPGYTKVPMTWCYGDNYSEMSRHADKLNKELFNLTEDQALDVVCSSMRAGPVQRTERL